MNENHDAFDNYVMKFDMNERMIAYKYNHSYRVVHQAEEICRSLDLDTYERDIASLIALFMAQSTTTSALIVLMTLIF